MNAKTETQSILVEYDLPHPPVKVWRALTESELLAAWLMDTDMQPFVGHSFTFRAQPTPWWDGIVSCEVLELELHKRLRYSWRSGPEPSGLDTVVTWTLTPTPTGGTQLSLEHSGFLPTQASAFEGREQGVAAHGWRAAQSPDADCVRPHSGSQSDIEYSLSAIACVRSPLKSSADAPKQGSEGAPNAWIDVREAYAEGLQGLRPGQEVVLITLLHQARRDLLKVHPRDDRAAPLAGVFSTRSADRPNPLGLHQVKILQIDRRDLEVGPLEALDGTPVLDIKPALAGGTS